MAIDTRESAGLNPYPLYELTLAVAAARRSEDIFDAALRCLRESLGVDKSSILLFDEQKVMRFRAWTDLSDAYRAAVEGHSPWTPDTPDPQPVLVADAAAEPSLAGLHQVLEAEGIRALAFIPLSIDSRLAGKFMLYYAQPHDFTPDEVLVAQTIAAHVGFAVGQQQSREQRGHLEAMFHSAVTGIAEIDADARFLTVNDRFCELIGRTREDVVGRLSCYDVTHADDCQETRDCIQTLVDGAPHFTLEKRYSRPDGSQIWVSNSVSAIRDDFGRFGGAIAVVTDITERKQADEALRESEQRYRELVEALALAVYTTDAEGRIVLYNDEAARLWGRSPEVGELWCGSWRIYTPEGEPLPLDSCPMAVALKENRAVRDIEIVVEQPGGERRLILPFPTPLRDASGKLVGAVNVLIDITERKQAETQLAQRNELIQSMTDNMSVGLVMLDADGNVEFMNPAVERITGYRSEDLRGKSLHQTVHYKHPDGTPYPAEECPLMLANERMEHFSDHEDLFVRPDGSFYNILCNVAPIVRNGERVGALLDIRDITARKTALLQLQESELKFRTLTSFAPAGIFLADAAGDYHMVNERWRQFAGMEEEKALGTGWVSALHTDDRDRVLDEWQAALEEARDFSSEYRFQRPDGRITWLRSSATALIGPERAVSGYIGTVTDITDLKQAEELKDQFLGLISHELRTPLATIYGSSRLLRDRFERIEPEDRISLLQDLVSESERLQRIIENLLLMTKLDAGGLELEPVALQLLVNRCVDNFRARNPGREVILSAAPSLPPVLGNAMYVELVIENFLSNANKYSAPEAAVEISVTPTSNGAEIRILDRGIGLAEDQDKLFTPFYRSRAARGMASGTGVGLAVCRRVIEAQNGQIWAKARDGGGSEFGFSLLEAQSDQLDQTES